jgi:hypothetical protein
VTLRSAHGSAGEQAPVALATFQVTFSWYRELVPNDVANWPVPSKYNVAALGETGVGHPGPVPNVI